MFSPINVLIVYMEGLVAFELVIVLLELGILAVTSVKFTLRNNLFVFTVKVFLRVKTIF